MIFSISVTQYVRRWFVYKKGIRHLCIKEDTGKIMKRVLNVAEKNDAAKNLASILSNGNSRRVSKYFR